jgi:Amt family ammonium transporter
MAAAAVIALTCAAPAVLHAQEAAPAAEAAATPAAAPAAPTIDHGDNAWMMTSSALVLFMTLPGLGLFYGGLVRRKNILSQLAQCLGITGLVTLLWWAVGFSLSFAKGNDFLGGTAGAFLKNVTSDPGNGDIFGCVLATVPYNVFCIFQLTFAIITPALIFGATAERMKFSAVLLFTALWMFAVYFPLAHMVWGGGLIGAKIGALDFAGGTVVHMSSGWTALVLCILLGKRMGFGKEPMAPHSMVLCMVGTGILWVGWYGFNAGSAGAADGIAAAAFIATTLAAAIGGLVWALLEWVIKGKPSVLGFCSGIVAGLVVITPAAGFVNTTGAVIIGVAAGVIPFFAVTFMKKLLGYDDALDTFGVHGVGGTIGAILTGVLADKSVNSLVPDDRAALIMAQVKACGITIALVVVAALVIGLIVKFTIGLRATPEAESQGLDINDHGEEGYILN